MSPLSALRTFLAFFLRRSRCLFRSFLLKLCSAFFRYLVVASLPRYNVVSVVLTFNASLNALAPTSPILLSALSFCSNCALLVVLLLLHTSQVQRCQCCVDLQSLAQCACSSITDLVGCIVHFVDVMLCFFFRCLVVVSHPKDSFVSAVLTFNASLSTLAPTSSIPLSALPFFFVVVVRLACRDLVVAHFPGITLSVSC